VSELEGPKDVVINRKAACKVTLQVGENVFSGISTHFSNKGILVMSKNPAPLHTKGNVSLRFPSLQNPVELAGEVVWTNVHGAGDSLSPRGMGIKFTDSDKATDDLLLDLAAEYETIGSIYACYYT
jgi:Tfp pilus assembly protein PilZ